MDLFENDKASFSVHIKYLRGMTWQGTMRWLEGGEDQNFRSSLELIQLMDDAVQALEENV